jgi:UDP-2,3-diacylglucosamine hydrolase
MRPVIDIELPKGKKIYFLSDFHLGVPNELKSRERELKIIKFLDEIEQEAASIFFVGDVYDFWYEYRHLVPKGFTRFQGKLAHLADKGIKLYFFPGNHDLWMFGYYEQEFGAVVSRKPLRFNINGKLFYIVHGDGYGPGDFSHKLLLKVFESKFFQWLFSVTPQSISFGIANAWSRKSRISNEKFEEKFLGENEWLWQYSKEIESKAHHDYYIFGHRHLPLELKVSNNSMYINLGEWFKECTYAVFDGGNLVLKRY